MRIWRYLQKFDFITLQKTRFKKINEHESIGGLDRNLTWREKIRGRAKSAVLVGLCKEHGKQAKQAICTKWRYKVRIENLRSSIGKNYSIIATDSKESIKNLTTALETTLEE